VIVAGGFVSVVIGLCLAAPVGIYFRSSRAPCADGVQPCYRFPDGESPWRNGCNLAQRSAHSGTVRTRQLPPTFSGADDARGRRGISEALVLHLSRTGLLTLCAVIMLLAIYISIRVFRRPSG